MKRELTEKEKLFVAQSAEHRKDKIDEVAGKMLAICLERNLPVWDLPYYVVQRAKEIISKKFQSVSFRNEKLQAAQKEFFKKCLAEMNKKEVTLDVLAEGHVKDETEQRDANCEPVAQELVKLLLDEKLVFSDDHYFDTVLEEDGGIPLNAAISGYSAGVDDTLLMAISNSWNKADDKIWGIDKDRVTFKQVDEVLKRP